jgi:predicted ATPase/DNA-binding XRE family transcriptional regulator
MAERTSQRSSLSFLLKRYRLAAGLSQEALAQRADLSARAISDLERGLHRAPRIATVDLLAQALSLSPQQRTLLLAAARPDMTTAGGHEMDFGARDSATSPTMPHSPHMPAPPTAMIGREREYEQALALLANDATRLVTLTGPSGVGKTRLALQLAHDISTKYRDGAVFVDLAPITDAALVPAALAQALHLRERADMPIEQQIQTHLSARQVLLLLDNFEQVSDAAPFVADLLAGCPRVTLLVTSRIPLSVRAEQTLRLTPLALEDAIVLFRERTNAVRRSGSVDVAEAAAVCERVDCLPLAIELVAGQAAALSLTNILDNLNQHRALVGAGARDRPVRQRTMDAAISWSYDLLTAEQQRCFRALGVFHGGMALPAVESVAGEQPVSESPVLESLAALVDASLLQAEFGPGGAVRFSLLELVREYANRRLGDAGEGDGYQRRHAEYFALLADQMMTTLSSRDTRATHLAQEIPNVRAALAWAADRRDAALGMRLVGVTRLMSLRGMMTESEYWLATMLALDADARGRGAPTAPLRLRAERLYGYARELLNHGDFESAEKTAHEAVTVAHESSDQSALSEAYATLGLIAQARNDFEAAERAFTESVAHAGADAPSEMRYPALFFLAQIARNQGNFSRAHALLEDALAGATAAQNSWDCAIMNTLLAHLERQMGGLATARTRYLASLAHFQEFGASAFFAWCLEGYCALLNAEGRYALATRLAAAAASLREQAQWPLPAAERDAFDMVVQQARDVLGEVAFAAEWRVGSSFTEASALAEAGKSE